MTEDIYTNGSATLGSPSHSNGREVRKIRLVQFEKVTEEPMVRAGKIPQGWWHRGGRRAGRAAPMGWPWGRQEITGESAVGRGCWMLPGIWSEPHQWVMPCAKRSSHGFSCLPGNHAEAQ